MYGDGSKVVNDKVFLWFFHVFFFLRFSFYVFFSMVFHKWMKKLLAASTNGLRLGAGNGLLKQDDAPVAPSGDGESGSQLQQRRSTIACWVVTTSPQTRNDGYYGCL